MIEALSRAVAVMKSKNVTFPLPQDAGSAYGVVITEMYLPTRHGDCHAVAFRPEGDQSEKLPLIVNLHGGAFVKGIGPKDVQFCAKLAQKLHAAVVDIDYETAPEVSFPVASEESYDAALYLKEHAEELALDVQKPVILGHSAGGNVAAGVCLMDAEQAKIGFAFQFLDYPFLDASTPGIKKPHAWVLPRLSPAGPQLPDLYFPGNTGLDPIASPVLACPDTLAKLPFTMIYTCAKDPLQDEGEHYADCLRAAGVPVLSRKFKDSEHGFLVLQTGNEWPAGEEFLYHVLRGVLNAGC